LGYHGKKVLKIIVGILRSRIFTSISVLLFKMPSKLLHFVRPPPPQNA